MMMIFYDDVDEDEVNDGNDDTDNDGVDDDDNDDDDISINLSPFPNILAVLPHPPMVLCSCPGRFPCQTQFHSGCCRPGNNSPKHKLGPAWRQNSGKHIAISWETKKQY